MKVSDSLTGLVVLALGVGVVAYGAMLPPLPGLRYGAGLFPMVIGSGLVACGLSLAVQGASRRAPALVLPDWVRSRARLGRFALVPALLGLYVLVVDSVGFIPASLTILLILMRALGRSWRSAALLALVGALLIQAAFGWGLRVPLPAGPLTAAGW